MNGPAVLLLLTLAASITAGAQIPDQKAVITGRHGNIEHLEVDAGRLVDASVTELVQRHLYDITYEDPRLPDPKDYVDITRELSAVPPNTKILRLRNRQMSVDLDTSRGVEGMLNQIIEAAALVHPEAKFRVMNDGVRYHVVPADGSLLDTRISLPAKPYTLAAALKAIAAAVKAKSGRPLAPGCCFYEVTPDEPLYHLYANDEPARDVMNRLISGIASAGKGRATWLIHYDIRWDEFTLLITEIPDRPVYSMP